MPDRQTPPPTAESAGPAQPADERVREVSGLATYLQSLAEREKAEIARTLHDELGGLLTAAKMDLSWLQSRVPAPELQERLAQLGSVLDEAMDLKRRLVDDLRPSLLDHFGLPTALRTYVDAVCLKAGLQVDIDLAEEAQGLPRDTAIAVFRIVQEGLSNIIRHGGARHVRLLMAADSGGFALTLSDDGRGFDPARDPAARATFGLTGMRQRVSSFGGTLVIDSETGRGTLLSVQIPMDGATDGGPAGSLLAGS
ncbi:MAG TPA: sensor histidine kinase [Steroidobacteraceae bacterium]|nr:sensor histidine kinase [Steroidobacteraceae bacterium]